MDNKINDGPGNPLNLVRQDPLLLKLDQVLLSRQILFSCCLLWSPVSSILVLENIKRETETISSFVKATLPVIKEFRKSFFKSIWWMLIQILFLITKLSKINLLKNFGNFDHCILTYFLEFYCGNTLEDIFA